MVYRKPEQPSFRASKGETPAVIAINIICLACHVKSTPFIKTVWFAEEIFCGSEVLGRVVVVLGYAHNFLIE